jgi:hypothetical protein
LPRRFAGGDVILHLYGTDLPVHEPIYNLESPGGDKVARLGFVGFNVPVVIDVKLRSEEDYGLTTFGQNLSSVFPLVSADVTIWGVPAASSHDTERQTPEEVLNSGGTVTESPPRPSGLKPQAFLTDPTTCDGPLSVRCAITPAVAAPKVAAVCGGFEPPTSWVRFRDLAIRRPWESCMASGFAPLAVRRRPSPICADMRRLSGCSGRNADFCLIGRYWV